MEVTGEDQVCDSSELETNCLSFEQDLDAPGHFRALNAESGEVVAFSVREGDDAFAGEAFGDDEGGRQSDAFAYIWGLMPTLLDMANIAHPAKSQSGELEPMRGRSLAKILDSSSNSVYGDGDFVGGEMQNGEWMRHGDMKAASVAPPCGDGSWQLYDVVKDPGETRDLAVDQPAALKKLVSAWEEYAKEVGVVPSN